MRKGQGGRGGGGNDGKHSPLPVFLSVLLPSQPDCGYAELHKRAVQRAVQLPKLRGRTKSLVVFSRLN